jgi:hypothetical protein
MSHATRAFMHATRHVICPLVFVTWKVMGEKHEKVGKKKTKRAMGRLRGKNCTTALVLTALTTMGICNWGKNMLLCNLVVLH